MWNWAALACFCCEDRKLDANPKSAISCALSHLARGAYASSRTLRRDAVDAAVSQDERHQRGRLSRVVLTPRRWRQVGGDDPQATVAKEPGRRGEHEAVVKTIAQGRLDR